MEQGLAIRQARLARNMTQAHLAGLAGVSEKTVRRAEAGDGIRPDSVRALCAALGLDASKLRSEAEMNPAEARRRETILARQVWGSRAAILCLGTGCVMGPLASVASQATWFQAAAVIFLMLFSATALLVIAIAAACLVPSVRRFVTGLRPVAWVLARREAAFLAGSIAFCTYWLCSLPYQGAAFLANPGQDTGLPLFTTALILALTIAQVSWLVIPKGVAFPPEAGGWAADGIPSPKDPGRAA